MDNTSRIAEVYERNKRLKVRSSSLSTKELRIINRRLRASAHMVDARRNLLEQQLASSLAADTEQPFITIMRDLSKNGFAVEYAKRVELLYRAFKQSSVTDSIALANFRKHFESDNNDLRKFLITSMREAMASTGTTFQQAFTNFTAFDVLLHFASTSTVQSVLLRPKSCVIECSTELYALMQKAATGGFDINDWTLVNNVVQRAYPEVQAAIASRGNHVTLQNFTDSMFDSLADKLDSEVYRRKAGALGAEALAKHFEETLAQKYPQIATQIPEHKYMLWARTEGAVIQNDALLRTGKDADMDGKQWVAIIDDVTRDGHVANDADGVIPMDQLFTDGSMDAGSGSVSPYNCRCVCGPALLSDEQKAKTTQPTKKPPRKQKTKTTTVPDTQPEAPADLSPSSTPATQAPPQAAETQTQLPGIDNTGKIAPSNIRSLTKPDHDVLDMADFDTQSLTAAERMPLDESVRGVTVGRPSPLDYKMQSLKEADAKLMQSIYDQYDNTRDQIRQTYGEYVRLWRAQGTGEEAVVEMYADGVGKATLNFASKETAMKYMEDGRELIYRDVPVDDIFAVFSPRTAAGKPSDYEEFIVINRDSPHLPLNFKTQVEKTSDSMKLLGGPAEELADDFGTQVSKRFTHFPDLDDVPDPNKHYLATYVETADPADYDDFFADLLQTQEDLFDTQLNKAVFRYSGTGYKRMNRALRYDEWDQLDPGMHEELDSLISYFTDAESQYANVLAEDMTLWRGMRGDSVNTKKFIEALQDGGVGTVIREKGFLSTSANESTARTFADNMKAPKDKSILLKIKTDKGTKFIVGQPDEAELIFANDTDLLITKVDFTGTKTGLIEVEARMINPTTDLSLPLPAPVPTAVIDDVAEAVADALDEIPAALQPLPAPPVAPPAQSFGKIILNDDVLDVATVPAKNLHDIQKTIYSYDTNVMQKYLDRLYTKQVDNLSSPELREAVRDYISSGYKFMNRTLRYGASMPETEFAMKEVRKNIKAMHDYFTKATAAKSNVLETDTLLWRGWAGNSRNTKALLDAIEQGGVGTIFKEKGFLSTTMEIDKAHYFADSLYDKGGKSIIMQIKVDKGTKFLVGNVRETELIFNDGSELMITKITKDADNVLHIEAQMVSSVKQAAALAEDVLPAPPLPPALSKWLPDQHASHRLTLATEEAWNKTYLKHEGTIDDWYKLIEYTPEELAKKVQAAVDDAEIFMAVDGKDLRNSILVEDGKFKNSLETGKGTFKTAAEARVPKEREVFGITADSTDYEAFPKYGFLSEPDMGNEGIVGWGYGDVFVKFKKDNLRNRTTYTLGDSYDGNTGSVAPPTALTEQADAATNLGLAKTTFSEHDYYKNLLKNAEDIDGISKATNSYVEAQIYGELKPSDVEAVYVSSRKEAEALTKHLKKVKMDHIKVLPLKFDKRLKNFLGGLLDKETMRLRASVSPADLDRLGDQYIAAYLSDHADALLSQWKHFKWKAPTEEFKNLLKLHEDDALSAAQQRHFAKLIAERIALKSQGGLPEVIWEDYRPTLSGWIDDVLNEDLLKEYPK